MGGVAVSNLGNVCVIGRMFDVVTCLCDQSLHVQASTAINLGFVVFICGWIMQVVIIFGYPYTPDYYSDVVVGTVIFTLLPWSVTLVPLSSLFAVHECFAILFSARLRNRMQSGVFVSCLVEPV